MASVSSDSYQGRYFKFTVTQSGTSTTLNWTFEVLGGESSYYTASPITCKIGSKTVYSTDNITDASSEKFPAAKGSKSGTYDIGSYDSVTISLSGRPWYHDAGDAKTATLTMTKPTYTITYNANGGDLGSVPSTQTKTHGTDIKVTSAKPTKTGYTFKGWSVPTRTDIDEKYHTEVYYEPNETIQYNGNQTLKAVWEENYITVRLWSNGATYGSYQGEILNNVKSGANVEVYSKDYKYATTYSDGLSNIQNEEYLYLSRTGYTPNVPKCWGTTTSGGTLLDQTTSYTGKTLAEAVGKSLASGNAEINLYAQWNENILTINYYSNYATSAFDEALNAVGSNKNVHVYTSKIYYDNDYTEYGLANYSGSGGAAYMTRTGYTATGNWGTTTSGGILIDEDDKSFTTGQAIAAKLGKDISDSDASINLYAQWRPNVLTIKYHVNGGRVNSDKYYIDNELISLISSSSVLEDKWEYNSGNTNGLYNITTFGLTREGYNFLGWKVGSSGSIIFNQDDSSVVPTDLASNITTGDRTITLYAVWEISGVVYIDDGIRFIPCFVYIDNGFSWDLCMAYVDDGINWIPIS